MDCKPEIYEYTDNGMYVKYTREYFPEYEDSWCLEERGFVRCDSVITIPADFMPLPEFPKRGFLRTVKYRICNMDLLGRKERVNQIRMIREHLKKRKKAWRQKLKDDEEKRERQLVADWGEKRMRETGAFSLLDKIAKAKHIEMIGRFGANFMKVYEGIINAKIDDINIDVKSGTVSCNGNVMMTIPENQMRIIEFELHELRKKVLNNGRQR